MNKLLAIMIGAMGVIGSASAEVTMLNDNMDRCELLRQLNGSGNLPGECTPQVRTRSIGVGRAKPTPAPVLESEAGRIAMKLQFDFNSSNISAEDMPKLEKLADALKDASSKGIVYRVEGNTDKMGSAKQNDMMSMKRAEAVRKYLMAQGVNSDQLVAKGNGFRNLADPTRPMDGVNRRVEVINTKLQKD